MIGPATGSARPRQDPEEGPWTLTRAVLVAAVLALLPRLGPAAPPLQADPIDAIRASNDRVRFLLRPGHTRTAADREALLDTIASSTDFPTVSRRILGDRWNQLPAARQQDFVAAFSRLVALSSIDKLGRHRADRVEYLGQRVQGARAEVRTAASFEGRRVTLDYDMARIDGAWKIVDYRLNGVSNAENYRRQFERILAREGFDGLMARIRQKVADLDKPPAP
jgi:phospholipid transport system substrate-binding protein